VAFVTVTDLSAASSTQYEAISRFKIHPFSSHLSFTYLDIDTVELALKATRG
jgi:hypothetical protein